jgi:hypothetical protein
MMSRGRNGFSSRDYEELERQQAERDWDIEPRPYRSKNSSVWDSLTRADWQRIGQQLLQALNS